jgi:hypothetical protein
MTLRPPVYICDNCRNCLPAGQSYYPPMKRGLRLSIVVSGQPKTILADFCCHQCASEWVHETLPEQLT